MEKIEVSNGVWLLDVPEADLSILCGCPPDIVKLLMKRGFINNKKWEKGLWENGPNAILLSDLPMQGGKFANLAEFPVLQMFYRQGMIIPGHPGNTGKKPILMGLSTQLGAVCEYLFRGTYGLADKGEILQCGIQEDFANEIIRLKMAFAFNQIRKSEDILELHSLDMGECEIRNGLRVRRLSVNRYAFSLCGKTVEIDLNLKDGECYVSPIKLEYHKLKRDYFSVVHIGEGDGWDQHRPCMASIIFFQGKIFLIDTGPNILDSLTALGISVNEIDGIFHTHAHDDHFAGLTSLVRTDHRIKYYSSALVRASVTKKLTSLMSVPENRFLRSFDVHDLKLNEWNNIDGLEVMPVFSPHPVETNVFFFRTMWDDGYKTYTHLSDIASREVLERILMQAEHHTPLSEKLFHQFTQQIEKSANLKKIDIGGGMIHGDAKDFAKDGSEKIVLAHLDRDLTPAEREIGSEASFGMEDVLIPTLHDYIRDKAGTYLRSYFPAAAENDIIMLLNCPIETLNIGHILQRRNMPSAFVYLIITGVAEMIQSVTGKVCTLSAGTLVGESCALGDEIPNCTYRAKSYINVLEIPQALYRSFIMRSADHEDARRTTAIAFFLQTTPLFGETVSSPVLYSIAENLVPLHVKKGGTYDNAQDQSLIIVVSGSLDIRINGVTVDTIGTGDFFGEECVFFTNGNMMSAIALEECECYTIGANRLRDIPIIEWKMLEVYERRLTVYGGKMS